MSLDEAEAEFVRLCKEISQLEKRLSAARKRAEKLAHYIEIAREYEARERNVTVESAHGEPTVIRLRRRRRGRE